MITNKELKYFESILLVHLQKNPGNIHKPKHISKQIENKELNIGTDLVLKHLQKIKTDKLPGADNLHPDCCLKSRNVSLNH